MARIAGRLLEVGMDSFSGSLFYGLWEDWERQGQPCGR